MTKQIPKTPAGYRIVGYCAVCGNDVIEAGENAEGTMQLTHGDLSSFDDRFHTVDLMEASA